MGRYFWIELDFNLGELVKDLNTLNRTTYEKFRNWTFADFACGASWMYSSSPKVIVGTVGQKTYKAVYLFTPVILLFPILFKNEKYSLQ